MNKSISSITNKASKLIQLATCLSGRYRQNAYSPTFTTEGPGNVMTLSKGASLHSILGNTSHNSAATYECNLHYSTELHGHAHTAQAFQSMFKYLNVHKT